MKEDVLIKKNNENNIYISLNSELTSKMSKDAYTCATLNNTFAIFKSISNKFHLIFSNINNSIICYDLDNLQIINEIKNSHSKSITNFRHHLDIKNKRDIILSLSYEDNNIKLWNLKTWECLLNLININNNGYLFSAYIFNKNNEILLVTSNYDNFHEYSEPIKIFDFYGTKLKEIENSNKKTYFVDVYFDEYLSYNFIIACYKDSIISFNYNKNEIYKKYYDFLSEEKSHSCTIIKNDDKIVKLFESCNDGIVRIWDFHQGLLLGRITVNDEYLNSICLWDEHFLFVACDDGYIKLVDLKNEKIIQNKCNESNEILTVKSLIHPKYGKCLFAQSLGKDQIKVYSIND